MKFLKFLTDAMFPLDFTCDICKRETFGANICKDCLKTITFNDGVTCPACGRKTVRPEICLECKAKAPVYDKAVSPLVFYGGGAVLIQKFKNDNAYLKEYFADLIKTKLDSLPPFDAIVYVPMTEKAKNKRGYNQSEILAESISERCGVPVIYDAVIKIKDTDEQKNLSKKERELNLEGCFKIPDKTAVKGKTLLLVDDVLTTGATAEAVSLRLKRAGATKVFVATAASVEYKQNDAVK